MKKPNKIMKPVYVTRDTYDCDVDVWPAYIGIRKFHGCVEWGAAWSEDESTMRLSSKGRKYAELLTDLKCRERFGFYPREGTAWYVNAKGKRTKVDIDFSN